MYISILSLKAIYNREKFTLLNCLFNKYLEREEERLIKTEYEIRLTDYSTDTLVRRILDEGLGDWCVLREGDACPERKIPLQHPLLYVTDIHTDTEYTLTKALLSETVNMVWIEFPWAVNWEMCDLDVMLLSGAEMDVLVQFACFDDVVYPYPW